jgi:hypothetical protein
VALGRDGEDAKLRTQLLALTLRTGGLIASEYQGFKRVLTILTNVFKNRHNDHSVQQILTIRIVPGKLRKLSGDAWNL